MRQLMTELKTARLVLQAPEGQQINVTLLDFTPAVKTPVSPSSQGGASSAEAAGGRRDDAWCPVIVLLREFDPAGQSAADVTTRETVVRACDSRVRKRHIYTSRDSKVRVVMPMTAASTRLQQQVVGNYMLHFEGNLVVNGIMAGAGFDPPMFLKPLLRFSRILIIS